MKYTTLSEIEQKYQRKRKEARADFRPLFLPVIIGLFCVAYMVTQMAEISHPIVLTASSKAILFYIARLGLPLSMGIVVVVWVKRYVTGKSVSAIAPSLYFLLGMFLYLNCSGLLPTLW